MHGKEQGISTMKILQQLRGGMADRVQPFELVCPVGLPPEGKMKSNFILCSFFLELQNSKQ